MSFVSRGNVERWKRERAETTRKKEAVMLDDKIAVRTVHTYRDRSYIFVTKNGLRRQKTVERNEAGVFIPAKWKP